MTAYTSEAGTEFVEVRHPDIEGTVFVPVSSLPQHSLAGWVPVESAPTAKRTAPKES